MSVRVWKRIALTAALLVWGAASQAQTTSGVTGGAARDASGGPGALPQTLPQVRPAPVTGRVATDPAAVALRPAGQQPLTSTARQVPPPVNPNEPLLTPESEQVKAPAASGRATRQAPRAEHAQQSQEATAPVATPPKQHVDRTRGVRKTNETQPRPHERKTKGKPHHAGQKASSVEPKDARHKGSKGAGTRGGAPRGQAAGQAAGQHVAPDAAVATKHRLKKPAASGKQGASTSVGTAGRVARHHKQPVTTHGMHAGTPAAGTQAGTQPPHQVSKPAHLKQVTAASKTRHAHAAAAKASAPVAKKPVRRQHPHA